MTAFAPAFVAAIGTAAATAITTQLLAPDLPDPPEQLADEAGALSGAADEEAARRNATSVLSGTNAVGQPQARVGTPTIVLGGGPNA